MQSNCACDGAVTKRTACGAKVSKAVSHEPVHCIKAGEAAQQSSPATSKHELAMTRSRGSRLMARRSQKPRTAIPLTMLRLGLLGRLRRGCTRHSMKSTCVCDDAFTKRTASGAKVSEAVNYHCAKSTTGEAAHRSSPVTKSTSVP